MKHTIRRLLFLVTLFAVPSMAEAKYRILPPEHVLGAAKHVVVGTVTAVGSQTFTLRVEHSVDTKVPGSIQVQRRRPRVCAPQDPKGIVVGSRMLWCLRDGLRKGVVVQRYGSWVGSPYWIRGDRVPQFASWSTKPTKTLLAQKSGPSLTKVLEAVKGYRARISYRKWKLYRRCSLTDMTGFRDSSPLAANLVLRGGGLAAPDLPRERTRCGD
jgi:hypothetical protein